MQQCNKGVRPTNLMQKVMFVFYVHMQTSLEGNVVTRYLRVELYYLLSVYTMTFRIYMKFFYVMFTIITNSIFIQ